MSDDIQVISSDEVDADFVPEKHLEVKTIHIVKIVVGDVKITLSRSQAKELQKILAAILS